jgi:hypothetical protein
MPIDKAPQVEVARKPQWELPQIVNVRIRATPYQPRATRNFENPLGAARDAVEIVVSLGSPMPIRALGPVLWVGDARLTESEPVDAEGKEMRFWSFDPSRLKDGAPIAMTWMGEEPPKKLKTKFRFKKPK